MAMGTQPKWVLGPNFALSESAVVGEALLSSCLELIFDGALLQLLEF
jgi:hypothetical protein